MVFSQHSLGSDTVISPLLGLLARGHPICEDKHLYLLLIYRGELGCHTYKQEDPQVIGAKTQNAKFINVAGDLPTEITRT